MTVYCDTSFFIRHLVPGADRTKATSAADELIERLGTVPITRFARFEVVQALRFEIWRNRKDRSQGLPAQQAEAALNLFLAEIGGSFQITTLEMETVLTEAERLTRSTPEKGWRTIDVIHVASAIG